jgi:outer membrane immunogenic protein
MSKFSFATIATALAFTGSAYAADLPVKAPPMIAPVAPSWTGWYIGVNGGGVWGRTDPGLSIGNYATYFAFESVSQVEQASGNHLHNSGGLAGGQIGYLSQTGKFVMGLEASFDWMKADGSSVTTAPYTFINSRPNTFTLSQKVSSNWLALFTARVGWDMGNWYPYITGGVAVADLKIASSFTDTLTGFTGTIPGAAAAGSFEKVSWGPTVGAGLEWALTNHWSLRGEYLFMVFNPVNGAYNFFVPIAAGGATFNHSATFSENVGRAALSYKF